MAPGGPAWHAPGAARDASATGMAEWLSPADGRPAAAVSRRSRPAAVWRPSGPAALSRPVSARWTTAAFARIPTRPGQCSPPGDAADAGLSQLPGAGSHDAAGHAAAGHAAAGHAAATHDPTGDAVPGASPADAAAADASTGSAVCCATAGCSGPSADAADLQCAPDGHSEEDATGSDVSAASHASGLSAGARQTSQRRPRGAAGESGGPGTRCQGSPVGEL